MAESLELSWDRGDKLCIHLAGKYPMLRIPAALEKGNQDRLLPITPDFAALLFEVPEAQRTGFVFNPLPRRAYRSERLGPLQTGRTIGEIGVAAGVVVNRIADDQVKYATAHDLRRSFGERWAVKVMPQVLMELMRHQSIETTLRYYVGRNAERTADILWEGEKSNTLSNTQQKTAPPSEGEGSGKVSDDKHLE